MSAPTPNQDSAQTTIPASSRAGKISSSMLRAALLGLMASAVFYFGLASMYPGEHEASASETSATVTHTAQKKHQLLSTGTLSIDARLSNALIKKGAHNEVHIAIKVKGTEESVAGSAQTPAHLSLVIDRSGSMSGERILQAKLAAEGLVKQLHDGDQVTIVAYDGNATLITPNTLINSDSRQSVIQSIRAINSGGSTCIACGLEAAEREMKRAEKGAFSRRIVLLSDGKPDGGEGALGNLRHIANRLESDGMITSTVGIGLDYNEKIMAEIAVSGNGNHHFAENPDTLLGMLEKELLDLRQLVARQAVVTFDLPKGARFVRGYDRVFTTEGNSVRVSLGDIPVGAERTILLKIALDPSQNAEQDIANINVRYNDLHKRGTTQFSGTLTALLTSDTLAIEKGIDSEVAARAEQAEITETVAKVSLEIEKGNIEQAREMVQKQRAQSASRNMKWKNKKLDSNLSALDDMDEELAKPAARSSRSRKRMRKSSSVFNRGNAY